MWRRRADRDLVRFVVDTAGHPDGAAPSDDFTGDKIYDALMVSARTLMELHLAGVLDESLDIFVRRGREQVRMDPSVWDRVAKRCKLDLDAMLAQKRAEKKEAQKKKKPHAGFMRSLRPYLVGAAAGLLVSVVVRDAIAK